MYLEFYGLKQAPFDITPNPRFLFHSAKHREAFNHMLYGIRERKGFVQLTGEVGAGKTTLCRAVLEHLDTRYSTALILNPVMSADELMKGIAIEFGLQVLSRKIDGLGPPSPSTPEERIAAAERWRNWFNAVRPLDLDEDDNPTTATPGSGKLGPDAAPPGTPSRSSTP